MFSHIEANYKSFKNYETSWRDIQLLNADGDADRWQTVSFADAVRASGLWDEQGNMRGPEDPILKDYRVALPTTHDQRHTFWFRDPKTGKNRVCK